VAPNKKHGLRVGRVVDRSAARPEPHRPRAGAAAAAAAVAAARPSANDQNEGAPTCDSATGVHTHPRSVRAEEGQREAASAKDTTEDGTARTAADEPVDAAACGTGRPTAARAAATRVSPRPIASTNASAM